MKRLGFESSKGKSFKGCVESDNAERREPASRAYARRATTLPPDASPCSESQLLGPMMHTAGGRQGPSSASEASFPARRAAEPGTLDGRRLAPTIELAGGPLTAR